MLGKFFIKRALMNVLGNELVLNCANKQQMMSRRNLIKTLQPTVKVRSVWKDEK